MPKPRCEHIFRVKLNSKIVWCKRPGCGEIYSTWDERDDALETKERERLMLTEDNKDRPFPILLAEEIDGTYRAWCPNCGIHHIHSPEDGHRVAHCHDNGLGLFKKSGYWLLNKEKVTMDGLPEVRTWDDHIAN